MSDHPSAHSGNRPIASGLLIAVVGPPLGILSLILSLSITEGKFFNSFDAAVEATIIFLRAFVPISYMFGGIPALFAGLIIGIGIYRIGWIGWIYWIGLAILLGFTATFMLDLMGVGRVSTLDFNDLAYFIGPAVFASLVLRLLIVKFGWMRRPESSAHPLSASAA